MTLNESVDLPSSGQTLPLSRAWDGARSTEPQLPHVRLGVPMGWGRGGRNVCVLGHLGGSVERPTLDFDLGGGLRVVVSGS